MRAADQFWRTVGLGAAGLGGIGAVAGFVIGLIAYPPTAWFAIFELGCPATALGAVCGGLYAGLKLGREKLRGE